MRGATVIAFVAALACAVAPPVVAADRVFAEPRDSRDWITHGPRHAPAQFQDGMLELQRRHPRFLHFTTVREELGEAHAVSTGPDGVPAWDPLDTGDGEDFQVVTVTDRQAPDRDKGYVLFTAPHAAEYCGREAVPRLFEDLARLADEAPGTILDGGTGRDGRSLRITVGEALRRSKLIFVDVAPDGWVAGDASFADAGAAITRFFSQTNGAGVNGNRVAHGDGWVFPDDPDVRRRGFSTMTQPEGVAPTRYLRRLRDTELGGAPFATAIDLHGPLPVGAQIFSDQGSDPAKLDRLDDLAARMTQRAYGVLAGVLTDEGAAAHREAVAAGDAARREAFNAYNKVLGGIDEKALYLTLQWNEVATGWEHIDYGTSSDWASWAGGDSGLDADAFAHELPCNPPGTPWDGTSMQLYVDNVRAMAEAMVVHAAFRHEREVVAQHDLGGPVGYVPGHRVTDADGNPSPTPPGERTPLSGELRQASYDVASTDWFRDLRASTPTEILAVRADRPADLEGLATVALTDHRDADASALRAFAEAGGNVVLTDAALRLLPDVANVPPEALSEERGYVGYADLDREHPLAVDLPERARQLFDPVGLGRPLLLERDQYWPCGSNGCAPSPTQNSAPMWTVDRAAWEALGGETAGTADPPDGPKGRFEGTDTDRVVVGVLPLGRGRVVILGGLLPSPSEDHPHWYGLNAYTLSITGQRLLLRALTWQRPA